MTRPQFRSNIPPSTAFVQRNVPVTFTANSCSQPSRVCLSSRDEAATPALLTRISTPPSSEDADCAIRATLSGSVTSQRTAQAR